MGTSLALRLAVADQPSYLAFILTRSLGASGVGGGLGQQNKKKTMLLYYIKANIKT